MKATEFLFSSIQYARDPSKGEKVLSLLSRYYYLGGKSAVIFDGNFVEFRPRNVSWKVIALKISTYLLLAPLTISLFIINFSLRVKYFTGMIVRPLVNPNENLRNQMPRPAGLPHLVEHAVALSTEAELEKELASSENITDSYPFYKCVGKIINAYYDRGDLEKVLTAVKHLGLMVKRADHDGRKDWYRRETTNATAHRVAIDYLNKNERTNALKAIDHQVFVGDQYIDLTPAVDRIRFLKIFVDGCKANHDLENFAEAIKRIDIGDRESKNLQISWTYEIADAYLKEGNHAKAFEAIELIFHPEVDDRFLDNLLFGKIRNFIPLAQSCYLRGDETGVRAVLAKIVELTSWDILRLYNFGVKETMGDGESHSLLKALWQSTTEVLYNKIKHYLANQDEQKIFKEIVQLSIDYTFQLKIFQCARKKKPREDIPQEPKADCFQQQSRAKYANLYAEFGLTHAATQKELVRAWRQFALRNHPDKFQRNPGESDAMAKDRYAECEENFKAKLAIFQNLVDLY